VAVACDSDVDGLTSALLVARAVEQRGGRAEILPARRGEHVHKDSMRERIRAASPGSLVVVDQGSRPGAIVPGLPTLLIDHHQPLGFPDGAVVVSAAGHEPVAASSLLAFELLRGWTNVEALDWLALLGTFADLGRDHPFRQLDAAAKKYGKKNISDAVALLNSARRAGRFQAAQALAVLAAATCPADIARGKVDGGEALTACREEVNAELARCLRAAPKVAGKHALLRFSSAAHIHGLVAVTWTRKLQGRVVIAANDGFLPGRVNFSMRCGDPAVDLVALVRGLPVGEIEGEWGQGHPRATGGSMSPADFERVLAALGF
jgi:single-stranded-DNA-specific exonuclease